MSLGLGLAAPVTTYRPFRTTRHKPATQSPPMPRCGLAQRSATQYQELAFCCSSFVSCWGGPYREAMVQSPSRAPGEGRQTSGKAYPVRSRGDGSCCAADHKTCMALNIILLQPEPMLVRQEGDRGASHGQAIPQRRGYSRPW